MTLADLQQFWALVVEVWHNGVGGVDIGRVLVALFILFLFFVLRGLIAKFLVGWLRTMAHKTRWTVDDNVVEAIAPPLRAIPVVFGIFVAANYMHFQGVVENISQNLTRTLIAIVIFWILLRALGPMSRAFRHLEKLLSRELIDWVMKALRVAVVLVGAATILQIWGIQIGPIIAGAGLFGVAVALGAQDLFKNLIAGILILGEKRFKNGDYIQVDGVVEGTVEAIGFRSTMVRRLDNAPVMVPNTQLSDTAVINYTQRRHRRIDWYVGLEYRTSIEQLRQVCDGILAYIEESDDFVPASEVMTSVRIDRFGASSIDILVYCFTRTTVWAEYLKVKEALAYKVMEIVQEAGAGFAFPSQSLYIETMPDDTTTDDGPEPFVPPTAAPAGDAATPKSET